MAVANLLKICSQSSELQLVNHKIYITNVQTAYLSLGKQVFWIALRQVCIIFASTAQNDTLK